MDVEVTVGLVGTGGALLGAIIGGAAARAAPKQGYKGALEAAARSAQHEAHKAFLDAAESYYAPAEKAVRPARQLIEAHIEWLGGAPSDLSNEDRARLRLLVAAVGPPDQIRAAVRTVWQAGPPPSTKPPGGSSQRPPTSRTSSTSSNPTTPKTASQTDCPHRRPTMRSAI